MIKKILLILAVTLTAAYLVLALTAFNHKPQGVVCQGFRLLIQDSLHAGFITPQEVQTILTGKKLNPVKQPMDDVHTEQLEQCLAQHPLIDQVQCYKTPDGHLNIELTQRIPILRVLSDNGGNYYLDNKGTVMPPLSRCVAHVPVATGPIEKSFAVKELYKFGVFLQKNRFWGAQTEQIVVHKNHTLEIVPRVGNHRIYLGKPEKLEQKLDRVKVFYEKGLNKVGWNKYSRINVEFDNQIICTKQP